MQSILNAVVFVKTNWSQKYVKKEQRKRKKIIREAKETYYI